jgi:hypothetical protein
LGSLSSFLLLEVGLGLDWFGGTRMGIPKLVLRVLSLSPCMAVDTDAVPSLMGAAERN